MLSTPKHTNRSTHHCSNTLGLCATPPGQQPLLTLFPKPPLPPPPPPNPLQVSWCKVELELPNAKGIRPAEPGSQLAARPSPPLTVAALNLRLHMDRRSQQQEILAASVVHMSGACVCGGGGKGGFGGGVHVFVGWGCLGGGVMYVL